MILNESVKEVVSNPHLEKKDPLEWVRQIAKQREEEPSQEEFKLQLEEQLQQEIAQEEKRPLGELKALLIQDKQAGLHRLIERYDLLFHQLAYNNVHNYDLARDAVSIAWINIYNWLIGADPHEITNIDLLPYLCGIVHNKSINEYNDERRQRGREKRFQQKVVVATESLEETFERSEKIRAVNKTVYDMVNQLPPKFAIVVRLRYGLKGTEYIREVGSERYKRIAAITGCNEATVRSYELRARKKMRKMLAKH